MKTSWSRSAAPLLAIGMLTWVLGCPQAGDDEDVTPPEDWVTIPGGTFDMGSDDGEPDEQPVHSVTVPDFEMWRTEVTAAQYDLCVLAGECSSMPQGPACNWDKDGLENHPVNCVSREQANNFCAWVGGRVPSEAEWEHAARSGGQDISYPWGDDPATCDRAVMDDGGSGCGTGGTLAVCSKPDGNTDQGLCDMAGNVREWLADFYHGCYDCSQCPGEVACDGQTAAPDDGSAWVTPSGSGLVRRGGGYYDGAAELKATSRSYGSYPETDDGFRCAR